MRLKRIPNVMDWQDNDNFGYILEVDLEYAKEVHNKHSDHPLAPENMNVLEQYLSDQRELFRYYYNGKEPKDEKNAKLRFTPDGKGKVKVCNPHHGFEVLPGKRSR